MPRKKKTFKVVGPAVEIDGKRYEPGETFEATPGAVDFQVTIGGVKEVQSK